MSEPTLNNIGDYNTLKGEKRRVVWAVIIAGLFIGSLYVIASKIYTNADDTIKTQDTIGIVPPSKSIPVR
jgi:formate/nitrite transporter FocA (FNT family)